MSAVPLPNQFFLTDKYTGAGRHWSPRPVSGAPSAMLAIPAAGTYYFSCAGILKPGLLNMGIALQPHGGNINVAYTLANQDMVMSDPASVPWSTEPAVNNQQISSSGNRVPSVIRITAASALVVYVMAS